MRIIILTQFFYPENCLIGLQFAKELQSKGHSVQVLTGFPNYPGGKIYEDYNLKFIQKENIEGISIIRVPLYPSHDNSSIHRIANYLSFAFAALFIGTFFIKKADIMYVYHPPASISIPAIFIKLIRRIPIVYDIQDFWPDTLKTTGMIDNEFLLKLIDKYLRFTYKFYNHIVVLSPGFKKRLISMGVNPTKIDVIYNWSATTTSEFKIDNSLKKSLGFNNKFNILFAGNIGRAQSLNTIIKAAEEIYSIDTGIQFVFLGDGVALKGIKSLSKNLDLHNIIFLPRVSPNEAAKIIAISDVLLVHLKDDPLFEITIPSKTQAYLKAGKPILMGVKGDAADLIKMANAGLTFLPEDEFDLIDKIIYLRNLPTQYLKIIGENGKRFYDDKLSIEIGTVIFLHVFNKVIDNNRVVF